MSDISRLLALVALVPGISGLAALAPARAADQPPASPVGVVDMERMAKDAEPVKAAYQELNALQATLTQNLKELDQYTYLSRDEFEDYGRILSEKTPTAAQNARRDELKKLATDRERDYQQLVQTQNPSPEQKKKMEDLTKMRNVKDDALDAIKQRYQKDLEQRAGDILPKLEKNVTDVIEAVAKDQKLAVVLAKKITGAAGPESVVLFGGKDITDEVIKRLNKK